MLPSRICITLTSEDLHDPVHTKFEVKSQPETADFVFLPCRESRQRSKHALLQRMRIPRRRRTEEGFCRSQTEMLRSRSHLTFRPETIISSSPPLAPAAPGPEHQCRPHQNGPPTKSRPRVICPPDSRTLPTRSGGGLASLGCSVPTSRISRPDIYCVPVRSRSRSDWLHREIYYSQCQTH